MSDSDRNLIKNEVRGGQGGGSEYYTPPGGAVALARGGGGGRGRGRGRGVGAEGGLGRGSGK